MPSGHVEGRNLREVAALFLTSTELAILHDDFVVRLSWLTDQRLLDAVAVGQFTPGPVFTTATFIGYVVGGWSGAIVATVGRMIAVVWQLGTTSIVDGLTLALAAIAAVLLIRFRVNSAWLVLGGAAIGLTTSLLRGQV